MKNIIIAILVLCCVASASPPTSPYDVYTIVWDEDGEFEEGAAVAFTFNDQTYVQNTASDGSIVFATSNFDDIQDGDTIDVVTKYGIKSVQIDYEYLGRIQSGVGVTFNAPSQADAIAAFLALGLIAIPIGNGVYRIFKKKED